jgi:hypothetical protein
MDTKALIRDKHKVHESLVKTSSGALVTKTGCKIYIPVRFTEHDLAYVGADVYTVGIAAIVVNDTYYAVLLVNAMVNLCPTDIAKVKIDSDEYYEFVFAPGATVIKTLGLVKVDTITYKIYDEIFSKGKIPWYIRYDDLCKMFDTAVKHAGANIGENAEVIEVMASLISRNAEDKMEYYRTSIKSLNDIVEKPPAYTAMRSVIFGATNTTSRLGGSYFGEGVASALVTPSERTEHIESLLLR